MTAKQHWDKLYTDGRDFRPINRLLLKKILPDISPGEALDIACGTGQLAFLLFSAGFRVTGVDLSEVAIQKATTLAKEHEASIDFQQMDIEEEFPDKKFDIITCKLAITFIGDKENFVMRVMDHLKVGGKFLVICPVTIPTEKYTDHYRRIAMDRADLQELLGKYSANVEIVHENYEAINECSVYAILSKDDS